MFGIWFQISFLKAKCLLDACYFGGRTDFIFQLYRGKKGLGGRGVCTTEKYTNWGSENSLIIHEGRFRTEKHETVWRARWRLFEYHSDAI